MIPGAFESEITEIPPMDEVLKAQESVTELRRAPRGPRNVRNQKSIGTSPIFGQLSDKPAACLYLGNWGAGRKAQ
jgi:hypothetical protein